MIFRNVEKIKEFLDTVDSCEEAVYAVGANGEYINLKDWLPSLQILIRTFNPKGIIKEMKLFCDSDSDMQKIVQCIGLPT